MRTLALSAFLILMAPGAPFALASDASAEAPLALGDREFGQSNYQAAEGHYREALAADPGNQHALSRLALLLTWRGEYKESIALYEKGLKRDPASQELRRGLATALTWSERYVEAIALYRRMLEERPRDEDLMLGLAQAQAWSGDNEGAEATLHALVSRNARHVKARLLLAQVHAWSGEPVPAEKIYRSLISEDPRSAEALAGLGDALADQGRLDEALASYDRALRVDPKNRAALAGRARAFQEQGRTIEALDAVRRALELYPDARDARRLGREIGGSLRPSLQLFANTLQDSDDNDLSTWGGTYTHYFGGHGYAGVTFTHAQTDARTEALGSQNTPVARYDALRAIGGWHASRFFSLYGEAGPERTQLPANTDALAPLPDDTKQHLGGSLTFEVNGAPWFALVGAVSEERLVGTTQAFMNDVGIRSATLTAIFRPHPSVRLRLTGQRARFDDDDDIDVDSTFSVVPDIGRDNGRDLATAAASWRLPLRRPRITVHGTHRRIAYDRDLDHGYFDPESYVSTTGGFDISDTIGRHFYWSGGADAGAQTIDSFDAASVTDHNRVFSHRALAGVTLWERVSIEAYYARSDLALQSTAGFKSTEGGVRLVIRFGSSLGPASPGRRPPARHGGSHD